MACAGPASGPARAGRRSCCPGSEKSAKGKAMKYITRVGEGVLAGWNQLEAGRGGETFRDIVKSSTNAGELVSLDPEITNHLPLVLRTKRFAWCNPSSLINTVLQANGSRPIRVGWGDSCLSRLTL